MFKKALIIVTVFLLAGVVSACTNSPANKNTNSVSAVDVVTGAADVKIKEKADFKIA
jgi:ABC-type Fe3+-citrate transport system substrate-binding protein